MFLYFSTRDDSVGGDIGNVGGNTGREGGETGNEGKEPLTESSACTTCTSLPLSAIFAAITSSGVMS